MGPTPVLRALAVAALLAFIAMAILIGQDKERNLVTSATDDCRTHFNASGESDVLRAEPDIPASSGRTLAMDQEGQVGSPEGRGKAEVVGVDLIEVEFRISGLMGAPASVEVWHSNPGPDFPSRTSALETDPAGHLLIKLPPGKIRASAYSGMQIAKPREVSLLMESERQIVEMELGIGGVVEGLVVGASDGSPIANASIRVPLLREFDGTRTDASGYFRLSLPLDESGYNLECSARGYASDSTTIGFFHGDRWIREISGPDNPHATIVHPEGNGTATVNFKLWPEGYLEGHVLKPNGIAAAGASVQAEGYFWTGCGVASPSKGSARTDENGDFSISGLLPDITYFVTVDLESFATYHIIVPPSENPTRFMETIVLDSACSWTGLVTDARGARIEGLMIRLKQLQDSQYQPGKDPNYQRDSVLGGFRPKTATTGASGEFNFMGLSPGACELSVAHDEKRLYVETTSISSGEKRVVDIQLPVPFLDIQGTVIDDKGDVVAEALVVLESATTLYARSDNNGLFRFRGLSDPSAWYRLHAVLEDATTLSCTSEVLDVQPGGPPVLLGIRGRSSVDN